MNEKDIEKLVRIKAQKQGGRLWRNNVGAAVGHNGVPIRFGLANDSAAINAVMKSSDLIGITPHVVTQEDVGKTLGIFTAVEIKRTGWQFKGGDREKAQQRFLDLVNQLGGRAHFETI